MQPCFELDGSRGVGQVLLVEQNFECDICFYSLDQLQFIATLFSGLNGSDKVLESVTQASYDKLPFYHGQLKLGRHWCGTRCPG